MNTGIFETLPILAIFATVVLLMLVSCEAGYRLGARVFRRQQKEVPDSLGTMVGALLGMLAFVLAFTFSMAASQHDVRKQNVLNEANAIGTAYLRTDLIGSSQGKEVKRLLREYVDIRLEAAQHKIPLGTTIERSLELHNRIWAQVSSAALESPGTNTALMIQSTNEVIDMHEKRMTGALQNRIPGSIWLALAAITMFTMITMGTQIGLTGNRKLIAIIPLVMAFAVLVSLVVDINRPQSGLITVNQQSMLNLQNSMKH